LRHTSVSCGGLDKGDPRPVKRAGLTDAIGNRGQRPLARPAFDLAIESGSLQLGQGTWKGDAEVRYDGNRFQGGTSGAISGVRIEELLNAFTTSKDKAFGRAEIPSYRLSFAGRDAVEIKNSLNGNGKVALEEGRIAMFDMVNTIQGNLNKALGGSQPAAGETDFARFASSVEIGGQMMRLRFRFPFVKVRLPSSFRER
jgi:uncharacterized protein involved in outer membrane biogenesis